jgi:hypothetical protein
MRVCETCKHKASPPPELADLAALMARYFPKVFYCGRLQVLKVYDPSSPAKVFDCELYEGVVEGEAEG